MQKPQPGDENFVESSRSLLHTDQEFVEGKQTAEIGAGTDMEFAQTHYGPRGVLLLYFRGDAAAEVDKHFDRTFSELCCLPGSSESDSSMDSSHWQGAYMCINLVTPSRPCPEKKTVARRLLQQTGTRLQWNSFNQIINISYESYRQLRLWHT